MISYINLSIKIIKKRIVVLCRTTGNATAGTVYALEALSGQVDALSAEQRSGPVTKYINMRVPGTTFGPNGKITYVASGGDTTKFYEHSLHVMSYVNCIKAGNSPRLIAAGG